jgi:hypothetical protein
MNKIFGILSVLLFIFTFYKMYMLNYYVHKHNWVYKTFSIMGNIYVCTKCKEEKYVDNYKSPED